MADTTPPTLTFLDLPELVDLSGGPVSVTYSATAQDTGGIDDVVIWFDRDVSDNIGTFPLVILNNGEASVSRSLLAGNAPGLVNVSRVEVTDDYGNERTYSKSELDALGFDTSFTISGSVADRTPPTLTYLDLPETVDLSGGPVSVTYAATAQDTGGIDDVVIWFDRDVSDNIGTFPLVILNNGEATVTRSLLTGNIPGLVNVSRVEVTDDYGNERTYSKAELDALGFDTSFSISGSVADTTPPTLTFLDLPETVDLRV